MKNLFVCYPRCTTCRRAQQWLDGAGIGYQFRDIKKENPAEHELRSWHAKSGLPLRRFFNTSGIQYRALGLADKLADMSEDEQYALLASDGMLLKRPIMVTGDRVLVGFNQADWERLRKNML